MPITDHERLHTLPVNGSNIDYSDHGGDGEPLLLIHAGVFADWFAPLAAEPALDDFRVIRMIRAGYGSGPTSAEHLTIADHAAHCAVLLDALGIDRGHIVAHSSGSVIALQLALDRPDLVDSLILCEPPPVDCLAAPDDLEFLHQTLRPVVAGAVAAATAGEVATAFDSFMTAACGPDYRNVLTAALGPDGLSRAEQESRYFFTDEVPAAQKWRIDPQSAAAIQQPVLLVQGGASPPHVHRLIAHLAAMIPHTTVAAIDNDDHLLPLRSPAELAHLVTAFAGSHRASPAAVGPDKVGK